MLYGEAQIAQAALEAVPNPSPGRDYRIDLTCPEFTCLCPRSGFPDFATIRITYVPGDLLVELRSLKLYLNRFRNDHLFHEAAANRILDDLVAICQPKWMKVAADFNVRGNIKTVITAVHARDGYRPPEELGVVSLPQEATRLAGALRAKQVEQETIEDTLATIREERS